jgi:anti-sigma B factor antagonist
MRVTVQHQPPAFDVEAHELDGIAVVAVRGEIDLVTAPQFEAAVEEAILDHGTPRPLLVDLEECTFMDSTGLAILLRAQERLGEDPGLAIVCAPASAAARLLELAARNVVRRYATRDEALAALR